MFAMSETSNLAGILYHSKIRLSRFFRKKLFLFWQNGKKIKNMPRKGEKIVIFFTKTAHFSLTKPRIRSIIYFKQNNRDYARVKKDKTMKRVYNFSAGPSMQQCSLGTCEYLVAGGRYSGTASSLCCGKLVSYHVVRR